MQKASYQIVLRSLSLDLEKWAKVLADLDSQHHEQLLTCASADIAVAAVQSVADSELQQKEPRPLSRSSSSSTWQHPQLEDPGAPREMDPPPEAPPEFAACPLPPDVPLLTLPHRERRSIDVAPNADVTAQSASLPVAGACPCESPTSPTCPEMFRINEELKDIDCLPVKSPDEINFGGSSTSRTSGTNRGAAIQFPTRARRLSRVSHQSNGSNISSDPTTVISATMLQRLYGWRSPYQDYENFSELPRLQRLQLHTQYVLKSRVFEFGIGMVILANLIVTGVEVSLNISREETRVFEILEHVFLIIYILELCMRFFAEGRGALRIRLTLFDLVLVMSGIICSWVIAPLFAGSADDVNDKVFLLRTFRLLRLIRALRLLAQFNTLWRLVQGLMNSLDILCSTLVLLCLTLYVLAVVGLEIIGNDAMLTEHELTGPIVEKHFQTLSSCMLTLIRFVTLDDLAELFAPMIRLQPILVVYYICGLLVVSIALMNLVTAVLVEKAIQTARMDSQAERTMRQAQLRNLMPLIRELFQRWDEEQTGGITKESVLERLERSGGDLNIPDGLRDIFKPELMVQLFDILDADDSGAIDEEEFVTGVMQMAMTDVPIEARQTLKYLKCMRKKVDAIDRFLGQFKDLRGQLLLAGALDSPHSPGGYRVSLSS